MNILSALYKLLIGPLELFFEVVFSLAYHVIGNAGLSIVFLSLAMNFLVLPLYRRADALQAEERETELRLKPWVDHIKKTFTGDERFMMLQTYYRQNGYKQTDALKGSVSLLLEVPFFIAAYRFLSGLSLLQGISFGPIRDMGAPDALLTVDGISINILPILMTAINLVSAAIYMKGFPLKNKVQMVGMALVFLVLLYASPAGLVFYWTLNNVFSLLKNIFYKLKKPGLVLGILSAAAGAAGLVWVLLVHPMRSPRSQALALVLLLALMLPLVLMLTKGKRGGLSISDQPDKRLFLISCVFLTLLMGLLIPSAVIQSSPQEFVDIADYRSPLWYVVNSLLLSAGLFLIWLRIFYELAGKKAQTVMSAASFAFSACAVTDYMFFGKNYGNLSFMLQYDEEPLVSGTIVALNLLVLLAVSAVLLWTWKKKPAIGRTAALAASIAVLGMSVLNVASIQKNLDGLEARSRLAEREAGQPSLVLSRSEKNVVVLMMDRAVGCYLPYLMTERPELQQQFDGFTYYPNTLSYGGNTNVGSPALYGGYEYLPEEINKRTEESLESKQNEALKVMPYLFEELGYTVTVCDPSYAGYNWIPDLSIFDEHPAIRKFNTYAYFGVDAVKDELGEQFVSDVALWRVRKEAAINRNFFCYSLFKTAPLVLQPTLYNRGYYNSADALTQGGGMSGYFVQVCDSLSTAEGIDQGYLDAYEVLPLLSDLTRIEEDGPGCFLMMANETTHHPTMLQEPDYTLSFTVDNREYDAQHPRRQGKDGTDITFTELQQVQHYHVNMSSLIQLGRWMDYLRQEGVYDNTRIIIVADHGWRLNLDDSFRFGAEIWEDAAQYNPLLMVKDFDSHGFATDGQFMTNGDVPLLATAGLIDEPRNPATGKLLSDAPKHSGEQHVFYTDKWQTTENNGNTFLPGSWYALHGENLFDMSAWEYLGDW